MIWKFRQESDHGFTRFTQKDTSKPLLSELKAWHRGLSRDAGLAPALEAREEKLMRRGRDARRRGGRQAAWFRVTAAASSATLLGTLGLAGTSMAATGAAAKAAKPAAATAGASCHLGNGVKHVVTLMFDNVHYFRDNPNVPSDLQLMPNLLNFFEGNGTLLSNNHTPLIAHTADDILCN